MRLSLQYTCDKQKSDATTSSCYSYGPCALLFVFKNSTEIKYTRHVGGGLISKGLVPTIVHGD